MSERALRFSTVALAAAGTAIASYLLVVRWSGGPLACTTGGCETVQHSAYAEVLGVPVAALGLGGSVALLVCACARGHAARVAQATLALTALFFSGYLLVIQVAVIGAICQWCVAGDALTTAIAALSLLRLRAAAAPVVPAPPQRRPHPQRRPNGSRGAKRPRAATTSRRAR